MNNSESQRQEMQLDHIEETIGVVSDIANDFIGRNKFTIVTSSRELFHDINQELLYTSDFNAILSINPGFFVSQNRSTFKDFISYLEFEGFTILHLKDVGEDKEINRFLIQLKENVAEEPIYQEAKANEPRIHFYIEAPSLERLREN
jgi:hypothetical protein